MEIPVTPIQIEVWEGGMLIQNAMPNISTSQREFIMTGISPNEWRDTFGE